MQSINVKLPVNNSPVVLEHDDRIFDIRTSRMASELQKLKNSDIASFTSKDMLSKRETVAEKTGKGNAFYTSSCFKDLKQMYKRNNPVQASFDKKSKIVINSLERKKKVS